MCRLSGESYGRFVGGDCEEPRKDKFTSQWMGSGLDPADLVMVLSLPQWFPAEALLFPLTKRVGWRS